jgi:hypothetical protein
LAAPHEFEPDQGRLALVITAPSTVELNCAPPQAQNPSPPK